MIQEEQWEQFLKNAGELEAPIRAFMRLITGVLGRDATPSQAAFYADGAKVIPAWDTKEIQCEVVTLRLPCLVILSWNTDRYHFDVELLSNGTLEWYFSDSTTRIPDGGEDLPQSEGLPPHAMEYLRLALDARSGEVGGAS